MRQNTALFGNGLMFLSYLFRDLVFHISINSCSLNISNCIGYKYVCISYQIKIMLYYVMLFLRVTVRRRRRRHGNENASMYSAKVSD